MANVEKSDFEILRLKITGVILHVITILFTLFLSVIAFLYGVSQLFSIDYSNFFCDETYTLEEIYQINLRNHISTPCTFWTCLKTHAVIDRDKITSENLANIYRSTFDTSKNQGTNIFYCICYGFVCLAYLFIAIYHTYIPINTFFLKNINCKNHLFQILPKFVMLQF